jgi:hypothetical protein
MQIIADVLRTIIDQRSGVFTPLSQIRVLENCSSIFALPQEIAREGMPIDQGRVQSSREFAVCFTLLLDVQHRDNPNVSGPESWVLQNTREPDLSVS